MAPLYSMKAKVKVRTENPANKSGFSWHQLPFVTIHGDTVEAIADKAYSIKPPDDIDTQAISVQGSISLLDSDQKRAGIRKGVLIDVFREL
jgi:hypothetical protein